MTPLHGLRVLFYTFVIFIAFIQVLTKNDLYIKEHKTIMGLSKLINI